MSFDPATISMISTIASVGSGVMGAVGAIKQGEAASQAAEYRAAVARNNAIISDRAATAATQAGVVTEQAQRQKTAQLKADQIARIAGSGIDPNSGSSLDLQRDVASLGELDALTIRNNAARQAYGYTIQGDSFEGQAQMEEATGRQASNAGMVGAFSSILSAGTSVSDKWARYKLAGLNVGGKSKLVSEWHGDLLSGGMT